MTTACAPHQPNQALRAVRQSLNLSQHEFAALIRKTGGELGEPNGCTKRLVQKWESGRHTTCRPNYRRALQEATQTPYSRLGFRDAWSTPPSSIRSSGNNSTAALGGPSGHVRYALAAPIQATREAVTFADSAVARLLDT